MTEKYKELPMSSAAMNTVNPIRRIVDTLNIPQSKDGEKKMIPLSIGDPTVFGNLKPLKVLNNRIKELVDDQKTHGYQNSAGMMPARESIAARESNAVGRNIKSEDVIIASGCSGAIEIAIRALASPGENILIPQPGFSIYQTIALSNGIQVKFYPLLPEKRWEADILKMNEMIDDKTRAIIVNNPSNPCGSVYSEEHLRQIADVARNHQLPILADEIYGNLCFTGYNFYPMAKVAPDVPVIHVGGIAKEFLVPGFRVGWIIVYDNEEKALKQVRQGMLNLSQIIVGASSLIQAALPDVLTPMNGTTEASQVEQFHSETKKTLESNALYLIKRLKSIKGISIVEPQGAMYVMIGTGKMSDKEFSQKLLDEELVFVLPGSCFGIENFVRIVFCAPEHILSDACDRIEAFCTRQFQNL